MTAQTIATALVLSLAGVTAAQAPGPDPIAARLFPPELIMAHQQEIGLDEKQRAAIVKEIQALQSQVVDVQFRMQAAMEAMVNLLDAARVDEAKVLAQADKLMGYEREVKRAHLTMLVRIRNLLTDAQRAKLAAKRR